VAAAEATSRRRCPPLRPRHHAAYTPSTRAGSTCPFSCIECSAHASVAWSTELPPLARPGAPPPPASTDSPLPQNNPHPLTATKAQNRIPPGLRRLHSPGPHQRHHLPPQPLGRGARPGDHGEPNRRQRGGLHVLRRAGGAGARADRRPVRAAGDAQRGDGGVRSAELGVHVCAQHPRCFAGVRGWFLVDLQFQQTHSPLVLVRSLTHALTASPLRRSPPPSNQPHCSAASIPRPPGVCRLRLLHHLQRDPSRCVCAC